MRAVVWTRYGPPEVLQLREVAKPVPKANEVLVRVRAATVTLGDCEFRSLSFPLHLRLPLRLYAGLIRPARITILGQELAGEVEAVGEAVTRFKPGDPVYAPTYFRMGAYAEYACLPEASPRLKPANLTFEEAATIPTGGVNGLHFLRNAAVGPGQRLLINGAGGSIGTYALQLAREAGVEVDCVDRAEKLDLLQALGARRVFDYLREDFTQSGERYDAVLDVVGKSPFSGSLRSLMPGGRYVLGNPRPLGMLRALWAWANRTTDKRVSFEQANYRDEDFARLAALLEAGRIRPVIDRRFPLEQTVEAHRYVESGMKLGNVVIQVPDVREQPSRLYP